MKVRDSSGFISFPAPCHVWTAFGYDPETPPNSYRVFLGFLFAIHSQKVSLQFKWMMQNNSPSLIINTPEGSACHRLLTFADCMLLLLWGQTSWIALRVRVTLGILSLSMVHERAYMSSLVSPFCLMSTLPHDVWETEQQLELTLDFSTCMERNGRGRC